MSLLTLVSSQRLAVSQTGFINSLGASTINVSSLFSPTIPSVSSLVSTTAGLQTSLVSTSFGIQSSIVSTSFSLTGSLLSTTTGLDALGSARILSTSAGLTNTIAFSASSFSTVLGSFQAGFPSTVSSVYGSSFTTLALNVSTQNIVNVIQPSTTYLYVAVGWDATAANNIKYSYDGIVWSNASGATFNQRGYGVAYNGSIWVAVGSDSTANNTIKYSLNGISWTNVSANGFSSAGNKVIWNGQMWVAVGADSSQGGTIKYSFNGITWFNTTNGFFSFSSGEGIDVAWNGEYFVAVGLGSVITPIRYSLDGKSWLDTSVPTAFEGRGITWNGSMWIAVGRVIGGTILQTILNSFDGINWNPAVNNGFKSGSSPFTGWGVSWNGDYFLALGQDDSAAGTVKFSYDGLSWSNSVSGIPVNSYGTYAVWNGRYWVATFSESTNTSIKYSFNGRTWLAGTSGFTGGGGYGIAFSSNYSNAYIQPNLAILYSNIPAIITSTNQILATPTTLTLNNVLSVNASNNRVGVNITLPRYLLDVNGSLNANSLFIGTSTLASVVATIPATIPNNISLSTLQLSTINRLLLQPPPNILMAGTQSPGGGQTYIRVSLDGGSNWRNIVSGDFTAAAVGFGYNGSYWVACGQGGTGLKYSFDGLNWSNAVSGAFTSGGFGVAWNGKMWVAGGQGDATIRYSFDGSNWLNTTGSFTTAGYNFAWNGNMWVGVGADSTAANTVKYSYDGINWSNRLSGTNLTFVGGLSGNSLVTWGKDRWLIAGQLPIASGSNAALQYSFDGLNWSNSLGPSFNFNLSGNYRATMVSYNGNIFVASGIDSNNNTRYSFDAINWFYALGSVSFSLNNTVWTGQYFWGFLGVGPLQVARSFDGITWQNFNSPGSSSGSGLGYSSNAALPYDQGNLQITGCNQYIIQGSYTSTNMIMTQLSSLVINETMKIDRVLGRVGINSNYPQYSLDIAGSLNTSSFFINTSSFTNILTSTVRGITASVGGGPAFPSTVSTSYSLAFNTSSFIASTINFINIPPSSSNLWVATGFDTTDVNRIKYSYDGITWANSAGVAFNNSPRGVAWNGTLWVAVGQDTTANNTIKYSFNGINWNNSLGSGFSSYGNAVAWNGRLWVAVGEDATSANTIKYSFNGITWANSVNGFETRGQGIAWNGSIWVATGFEATLLSTIKYSINGSNWSNAATGAFTAAASNVAWNGRLWVAVGEDGSTYNTMRYSFNGINWSNSVGRGFFLGGTGIAWNGRMWVAVGDDIGTPSTIKYSFDGSNWSNVLNGFTQTGYNVSWNGSLWVAVGQDSTSNNRIKYSSDGINWSNSASGATSGAGFGIAFSSNTIPSYNQSNLSILPQNIPTFLTSTNKIFAQTSSILINDTVLIDQGTYNVGINCNVPLYNLDVNGNANVNLSLSTGTLNTQRLNIFQNSLSNVWVITGQAGIRWSSNDGVTWNTTSNGFNQTGSNVAFNGMMWVAVGQDSTEQNRIKYSFNGSNWSNALGTTFSVAGQGVAWNGRMWVAAGSASTSNGHLKYSFDGITWSNSTGEGFENLAYDVAWDGGKWLAFGSPTSSAGIRSIKFSLNGITWSNVLSGAPGSTRSGAFNGWMWVVVGGSFGSQTIVYSFDGFNFQNATGGFSFSGSGIAWNGRMWVAVGSISGGSANERVKYSFDGINWSNSASAGFTSDVRDVAWNGSYWLAQGLETGAGGVRISFDGLTWTSRNGPWSTNGGNGLAWSSNQIPSYQQRSLAIWDANIPMFLTSTNIISVQPSTLMINNTLMIDSELNLVGVNNTLPRYSLDVGGSGSFSTLTITGGTVVASTNTDFALTVFATQGVARVGGTTWTAISDQRVKENIVSADLDRCYSDIKNIPLRRFTYTSTFFQQYNLPDKNVLGFIAQEVSTVQPKAITVSPGFGFQDMMWLNLDQMNMSLYGSVKKMMNLVEQQASTLEGQAFTLQTLTSTVQGLQKGV